jgi:acyl carrier protein
MTNELQLRTDIRRFVLDELLMGDAAGMLEDEESFLETGTIDSTGVLEVVMFLEQSFGMKVHDRELLPENLDSVERLVQFVIRKMKHAA